MRSTVSSTVRQNTRKSSRPRTPLSPASAEFHRQCSRESQNRGLRLWCRRCKHPRRSSMTSSIRTTHQSAKSNTFAYLKFGRERHCLSDGQHCHEVIVLRDESHVHLLLAEECHFAEAARLADARDALQQRRLPSTCGRTIRHQPSRLSKPYRWGPSGLSVHRLVLGL